MFLIQFSNSQTRPSLRGALATKQSSLSCCTGLLRCARNDDETSFRILATGFCPRLANNLAQKSKRAQGRPGARCTRGLVCNVHQKKTHTSIQVQRRHPTFPAQWFYAYTVLSLVTGLSCHHRP